MLLNLNIEKIYLVLHIRNFRMDPVNMLCFILAQNCVLLKKNSLKKYQDYWTKNKQLVLTRLEVLAMVYMSRPNDCNICAYLLNPSSRSWTDFILELSFLLTGYLTLVKKPSLSYYLPLAGERMVWLKLFQGY